MPHSINNLSERLAREACEDYLASIKKSDHPMFEVSKDWTDSDWSSFCLFAQDLAELVGLALAEPTVPERGHVAAQSARRALANHPTWIHAARAWALGAQLNKPSSEALFSWID